MKHVLTVALSLLALTGCSTAGILKSNEPQQTTYTLRPLTNSIAETGPVRIVEIPKPEVPPGFGRDRIALYIQNGQKLDYYASARWAAGLDEVLEEFTRRSLTTSLPYVVTVTPAQSLDANFRLEVKVNEFEPVYSGEFSAPPILRANIEYTLIRLPEEILTTSFTLSHTQPASSARLDIIIEDLETMLKSNQEEAFRKLAPSLSGLTSKQ
jgi:ABC-type uncharacterized transport system auxiliary subunit